MKKLFYIVLLIFTYGTITHSQSKFYLYTDYALFKSTDTKSIFELYFAVNQKDLVYISNGGALLGQANFDIQIMDKAKEKVVFNDSFGLQSNVNDSSVATLKNKVLGQQNFTLPASNYKMRIIGYDFNKKDKKDTLYYDFVINNFDSTKTSLSDIQLAINIEKSSDANSIFYKNGLEITPNPDALYGMNLNKLAYYFEVYSITKDFKGDDISLEASIYDLSNNLIKQNIKNEKSKHDAFVEAGFISVDSLEKGPYTFKVKLIDKNTGFSLEKEKKFHIYNMTKNVSSDLDNEKDYLASEYKTMSLEKLDDEYNKAQYIRTSDETNTYEKLKNLDEKRKFMFHFWKKRRYDPNSPANTFKLDYYKRINEANLYYKQGFMEGWKTDRGRIYVTYGKPSEIETHPNESDSKAYEIWTFSNVQGGAKCVFAEYELGTGMYHLVHSTIRGEFSDTDWQDKLKK